MNDFYRILRKLAEFDTPTIANAIEMFAIRPRDKGYTNRQIFVADPLLPPMVGFASTARLSCRSACDGLDAYEALELQLHQMESLDGPAVMVYEDLDQPTMAANVGEVMCGAYQSMGAAGMITSGAARDIAQIKARNFPLFFGSVIASHGYCHVLDVGKPVNIAGMEVSPNDLLHGDSNGITIIPLEIIDQLPDVAHEYQTAEHVLLDYTQGPHDKSISELVERRREMGAALRTLQQRVSAKRAAHEI